MNPNDYKTLPIPLVPQTQSLTSTTFRVPPLDGSLTVPEIHDWHLENSPNHPLFEYAEDDGAIRSITWAEAVRAIHRAGRIVQKDLQHDGSKVPIIAIVAASGMSCLSLLPIPRRNILTHAMLHLPCIHT